MIKKSGNPYDLKERMQQKIMRWMLDEPTSAVNCIIQSMPMVRQNCRPCVVAACSRTLWNGWPTSARMRH
eukprot:1384274-Karenia_brevis.AAC.1